MLRTSRLQWVAIALLVGFTAGCGSESEPAKETDSGASADAGSDAGGGSDAGAGDAGVAADSGPGLACGEGTKEVDGKCVVDEAALLPSVDSVKLLTLHAHGAQAKVLNTMHPAWVQLRLEVKGEAFKTEAVVIATNGKDKSCVLGYVEIDHTGGTEVHRVAAEMIVQEGCGDIASSKDLSLRVAFDPFMDTAWAERGTFKSDDKKSDAENLANLLSASVLKEDACTAPTGVKDGGFSCGDKVALAKNPGRNVEVRSATQPAGGDAPDSASPADNSKPIVILLEDTSDALSPKNTTGPANGKSIAEQHKAALMAAGVTDTAALNSPPLLPDFSKLPELDSLKGSGNTRPELTALVTIRVLGQKDDEKVDDGELSMSFAIRPFGSSDDDAWESLSTALVGEAKAGGDKTVEYLEELFFAGMSGVAEETLQNPVFIRGDARKRLLMGDWKDTVQFELRSCAEADFDEEGADDTDADNCVVTPLIIIRQKVAPSVGKYRNMEPPSQKTVNAGGGLSNHSLPSKGQCGASANHCDLTLQIPWPGTINTRWTYDYTIGTYAVFREEFGFGGGAFLNARAGNYRWYNSATSHVFQPGLGVYGHAFLNPTAYAKFSTKGNNIALYMYRPWKQPNPGGFIDEAIAKFKQKLEQVAQFDPTGSLQSFLDLFDTSKVKPGESTFGALFDIYTAGMTMRFYGHSLVDSSFPVPLLNVQPKPTISELLNLKLTPESNPVDVNLTIETVKDKNGIEFGLVVGKTFDTEKYFKSVGPAKFSLGVTIAGKLKFAIIREHEELEKRFDIQHELPTNCIWKLDDNRCYIRSPNDMTYYQAQNWCQEQGATMYSPHVFDFSPDPNHGAYPPWKNNKWYGHQTLWFNDNNIPTSTLFHNEGQGGLNVQDVYNYKTVTKEQILKVAAGTPDPLGYVLNLKGALLNNLSRTGSALQTDKNGGVKGPMLPDTYSSACPSSCKFPGGGIYYNNSCLRNPNCTVEFKVLQAATEAGDWLAQQLYAGQNNNGSMWVKMPSRRGNRYNFDLQQKWMTVDFAQKRMWHELSRPSWMQFWQDMPESAILMVSPRWIWHAKAPSWNPNGAPSGSQTRYRDDVAQFGSDNYPSNDDTLCWWESGWNYTYKCKTGNDENALHTKHYVQPIKGDPEFDHNILWAGWAGDYHTWSSLVPWGSNGTARAVCLLDVSTSDKKTYKTEPAEQYSITLQPGFEAGGGISGGVEVFGKDTSGFSASGEVTLVDVTLPYVLLGMRTVNDTYLKLSTGLKLVLDLLKLKANLKVEFKVLFVSASERYEVETKIIDELIGAFGGKKDNNTNWEWDLFGPITKEAYCQPGATNCTFVQ